jgi:hypothetical protein
MTDRNPNVRILASNHLEASATTNAVTGSKVGYPYTNALNPLRFKKWVLPGTFRVTASNKNVYINDGTNKTVTLTEGDYTYSTLAAHVQTKLNASSTLWVCTYDFVGSTFKFTINRTSGTAVLRLSAQTNAAWDMLGFTTLSDLAVVPFVANRQRNHTSEIWSANFGAARRMRALCMIGPSGETFSLSTSAVVSLYANNVNDYATATLIDTASPDERGLFKFYDDQADAALTYQYAWVVISDRENPLGPEGLSIAHVYLGDYTTLTSNNVSSGWTKTYVDPSEVSESEAGVLYVRERPKYRSYSGLDIEYLTGAERVALERELSELGVGSTFYLSLDPLVGISQSVSENTFFAMLEKEVTLKHIRYNLYSISFAAREVL